MFDAVGKYLIRACQVIEKKEIYVMCMLTNVCLYLRTETMQNNEVCIKLRRKMYKMD